MKYFLTPMALVIFFDLYSKNLAYNYLQEKINILWDFLFLKYTENTGIAFSLPLEWMALKIITIVLILVITFYFSKYEYNKKNKLLDFAFWLILWGAIWNGIERIFEWKVIDFLGVKYFSTFNIADSAISIWAIIYLIIIFREERNKKLNIKTN